MSSKNWQDPSASTSAPNSLNESLNRPQLHPYQAEVAAAIAASATGNLGLTISLEIARQGGKNEISARLEKSLLTLNMNDPLNLVKCAPTFHPQTLISMRRLVDRLNDSGHNWVAERGYIIRLGEARAIFLSAEETANVVGNTAHLLLEVDEAQDVSREKYSKEFRPMAASTNATTVLYGTTWDGSTLLEEVKQSNLELERKDGIRRHFRYDWEEVAKYNPEYRAFVEGERARLGEDHPLFRTQYRLLPLAGGGGFFSAAQRAQLQGDHWRRRHPEPGRVYVAGIDIAGEAESDEFEMLRDLRPRQDATVISIGELDFDRCDEVQKEPTVKVIEHYAWTGRKHAELYGQMVDLLKNVWHCKRVVVDATGMGEPVASFLRNALGSRVVPFRFTAKSKSELGFALLSAVNGGRLKMYAGDGSPEYRQFWQEMERAKSHYRPNQTVNFFVDASDGHDDFLMSLALVLEAGGGYERREARGR